MSTNPPIQWHFTLEYKPKAQKWHVSFNAWEQIPIFNKEDQEFTTLDACIAWLKTKEAEFNEGIDLYLKKLRQRTQSKLNTVLELKQ